MCPQTIKCNLKPDGFTCTLLIAARMLFRRAALLYIHTGECFCMDKKHEQSFFC